MENEKRLIDANPLGRNAFHIECEENGKKYERLVVDWFDIEDAPTVYAHNEEQVASIMRQVGELAFRNEELDKEVDRLKSCLNCKIRKECPRHCGKVVHGCDHWEYGDTMAHGQWLRKPISRKHFCSNCGNGAFNKYFVYGARYCPICGARMDGDGNG